MFVELTSADGSPMSVDKALIKMWIPTKVIVPGDMIASGTLVVVQGVGNYYVLENYDRISAMMTGKKAVKPGKPGAESKNVFTMKKPKT